MSASPRTSVVGGCHIPAVGELYGAREGKKRAWARVKQLRQHIKDEPLGGNRLGLRLELIRAEDVYHLYQNNETRALKELEKRARELGKTTIRPSKKNCEAEGGTWDKQAGKCLL